MKFLTNVKEMKAVIGVNNTMTVNEFPRIPMKWDCNPFIRTFDIQNMFARTKYQKVLQNLHFADNIKQNKQIKVIRLDQSSIAWMNHFKQCFPKGLSKVLMKIWQNSKTFLNEAILENEIYKMGFKWWFRSASSTGYLYNYDLYLGWRKDVEVNLG